MILTLVLDPHSLVDGVVSPTISLAIFSDESIAIGEAVSIVLINEEKVENFSFLETQTNPSSFTNSCKPPPLALTTQKKFLKRNLGPYITQELDTTKGTAS